MPQPARRSSPGLSAFEKLPLKRLRPGATVSGKVRGKPVINVLKQAKPKTTRAEAAVLGPPLEMRVTRKAAPPPRPHGDRVSDSPEGGEPDGLGARSFPIPPAGVSTR